MYSNTQWPYRACMNSVYLLWSHCLLALCFYLYISHFFSTGNSDIKRDCGGLESGTIKLHVQTQSCYKVHRAKKYISQVSPTNTCSHWTMFPIKDFPPKYKLYPWIYIQYYKTAQKVALYFAYSPWLLAMRCHCAGQLVIRWGRLSTIKMHIMIYNHIYIYIYLPFGRHVDKESRGW